MSARISVKKIKSMSEVHTVQTRLMLMGCGYPKEVKEMESVVVGSKHV